MPELQKRHVRMLPGPGQIDLVDDVHPARQLALHRDDPVRQIDRLIDVVGNKK